MTATSPLFISAIHTRALQRAAARIADYGFTPLEDMLAERLAERLLSVKRTFKNIAVLSFLPTPLPALLQKQYPDAAVTEIRHPLTMPETGATPTEHHTTLYADLNAPLPLAEKSMDLVLAPLCLQMAEDVKQTLLNMGRLLKEDGFFLADFVGGESFVELAEAFYAVEAQPTPHIGPMMDIRTAGTLLQTLQFSMPVADRTVLTLQYPHFPALYHDLRAHGVANVHGAQKRSLSTPAQFLSMQRTFMKAQAEAHAQHAQHGGCCGHDHSHDEHAHSHDHAHGDACCGHDHAPHTHNNALELTLEIITLAGWRPDKDHQKPLAPGSARISLEDVLKKQSS